ncbi:hypothetical protein [Longimicrobium sp.]|uniref:hypothetical protein n=1 Tax=Longimicrobium sp. TaxID=2029185 RepID=UPI002E3641D8|nr:hypothetical protein [Longimicrobium sp.]HEX6037884.1 hypothetical protein [Longimicrobium sp.]
MSSTDSLDFASAAATDPAARALLRHTVATLAYRGGKALEGAPADFAGFTVAEGSRTPVQILAHVGDLLEWALWMARGEHRWRDDEPGSWERQVARFFDGLAAFDAYLASDAPLGWSPERLFQGPVADALTHVGQLCMLRRLAGAPVRGENYAKADITAGRVGPARAASRVEFD